MISSEALQLYRDHEGHVAHSLQQQADGKILKFVSESENNYFDGWQEMEIARVVPSTLKRFGIIKRRQKTYEYHAELLFWLADTDGMHQYYMRPNGVIVKLFVNSLLIEEDISTPQISKRDLTKIIERLSNPQKPRTWRV